MSINTNLLALDTATTLTLATGEITITKSFHVVAAESGTADDLDTINIGSVGFTPSSLFVLLQADAGDTITVKDGTGNINLNGGADFDLVGDITLLLFYDGTNWSDTGAGGGGGGSGTVTSVGVSTDASYLTVGSSPVTTAGTITVNKTTALTANQVVATPDGAPGTADLRALVSDDIPSLSTDKLTSGTLPVARGGSGLSTRTAGALQRGNGTSAVAQLSGTNTGDMVAWVAGTFSALTGPYFTLAEGTLGSASASIALSSIPSTWQNLRLVLNIRGVVAATFDTMRIQVNSDTTAGNYFGQSVSGSAAGAAAAENDGSVATLCNLGIPAASSPANSFGIIALDIGDYKAVSRIKTASGISMVRYTTGSGGNIAATFGGVWNSTTAISSIQISLASGNIAAGTSYRLYGTS